MIQDFGNESIVLGKSERDKLDDDWVLSIGHATNMENKRVGLDSVSPHVIFVCGARGSGKSYTLGVIGEEIANSSSDIAAVVVDPVGIFWSMKYPNQEESEIEALKKMGMNSEGIENLKVFVPVGYTSEIPEETFDTGFSFKPSSLKSEDWCLTFGIDRYNPQGLLLERAIEKVKSGYTRKLGDKLEGGSRDVPPNDNFSIENLLECINHDKELLSKKKGFKGSTRRALTSRLSAAKDWGIFGREKKLSDLVKPGIISVIDISFLPENIGALVLGILARKIFSARKAAAREEAVRDLKNEEEQKVGSIPPTWLMVDEAHSFAPSSGKTAASDPLVEFVKQGRRPGLSAVLSTQQPSSLNSKIISQLDILLSHRLSFENDIKEVWKRMPTTLPEDLKEPDSLKKLPRGSSIAGDKEINRAFLVSIRPRKSQHEGRERVTNSSIRKESSVSRKETAQETAGLEDYEVQDVEVEEEVEERVEVSAVSPEIDVEEVMEVAESETKKFLGFFWSSEKIRRVYRHFYPFWSFLIDYYPKSQESMNLKVHFDGLTGEFIVRKEEGLERTRGVRDLPDMDPVEIDVLFKVLKNHPISFKDLNNSFEEEISGIGEAVSNLKSLGSIKSLEEEGELILDVGEDVEIPTTLSEKTLLAAEDIPEPEIFRIPPGKKEDRIVEEEEILKVLNLFGDIEIIRREIFYYPYWIAELVKDDESRILAIDGVYGNRDEYAERMLRKRVH
ncbi:hypothetical protein AKJ62_00630 [candidate division MSBL1 archaeon SCGC-AAA259D14]|uniref:Helicase HerA central domain-containing protein n=1 Tax=candidate division MSBL1 archaeon SCGC-AAA259D14 TaxID=1698261 RepID=A0A133U8J1_9EURY|nr:hypothetical protein AKJ62_00630 [candidate division MSBL1 archaeon SCGC-AAA259D14]